MRRGRAPLPGLLLAVALPLGIVATSAAATPPVHVTSHERLLHRRRRKRRLRISGERDRLGSGATSRSSSTPTARRCGCRSAKTPSLVAFARDVSHVQITRHSGAVRQCLDGKGSLPPRDFGDGGHRPRLTPTQGGRVMSAPHARGRMRRRRKAVFVVAVGALLAGALAAFMGQGVAASANPGQRSVARCPQADSGPGERPAGCDDLAREGRPDGPATRRQLDRSVQRMRQPGLGPAEPELHEDVARRQQHGLAACGRYGQPAGYDRPGRHR